MPTVLFLTGEKGGFGATIHVQESVDVVVDAIETAETVLVALTQIPGHVAIEGFDGPTPVHVNPDQVIYVRGITD